MFCFLIWVLIIYMHSVKNRGSEGVTGLPKGPQPVRSYTRPHNHESTTRNPTVFPLTEKEKQFAVTDWEEITLNHVKCLPRCFGRYLA